MKRKYIAKRLASPYTQVIGLWGLSKLLFFLLLMLVQVLKLSRYAAWETFRFWDASWYWYIAEYGYTYASNQIGSPVAYPPLYPLTGRWVGYLTGNSLMGLFIVSQLASLVGIIVFYQLLKYHYGKQLAIRGVALLLFSPVGWIFSVTYSESLFLLLSSLYFLWLHHGRLLLTAVVLSLLTLTRTIGIIYLLPFLWVLKGSTESIAKKLGLVVIAVSGVIGWLGYLWFNLGSPWVTFTAQQAWHHKFGPFPLMLSYQMVYLIRAMNVAPSLVVWFGWVLPYIIDIGLIALMVSVMVVKWAKIPSLYQGYMWLYLILVTSSPSRLIFNDLFSAPLPAISIVRYLTLCFPLIFILLNQYRQHFKKILQAGLFFNILYGTYFVIFHYAP